MTLLNYKEHYIDLLLRCGVLRFGEFRTKSGRISPYFFNMGLIDSGETLSAVATIYAEAIANTFGDRIDNLFGPAYKGIPLAVMTASRLASRIGRDVSFTFNRKESKDHGEGGLFVGRQYRGGERVVVVEDVITGGTSFREVLPLLRQQHVEIAGVIVGVDRQEKGLTEGLSALAEIAADFGVRASAIVTLSDLVKRLHNRTVQGKVWLDDKIKAAIDSYMAVNGAGFGD